MHLLLAPSAKAPADLVCPATLHTKVIGELPDETGVLLEHATNESEIEVVVLEVAVCLLAFGDRTYGTNKHLVANLVFDSLGEWFLVAGTSMDVLLLVQTARRNVQKVDALLGKLLRKLDGILKSPALDTSLLEPVGGTDTEK